MGQNLIDLKSLIKSERFNQLAKGISSGISGYEKRVKAFVKDLDIKGRDARTKSKEQLDRFTTQLRTTRTELEKRVVTLVNSEADRLNKGFNELVGKLKHLSQQEQQALKKSKGKAKAKVRASAKKASSAAPKKKAVRRKTVAASDAATSTSPVN